MTLAIKCNCTPITMAGVVCHSSKCDKAQVAGTPIYAADFPPNRGEVARQELEAQRERGEWSGAVDSSGGPVYTLAEIAAAVARAVTQTEHPAP